MIDGVRPMDFGNILDWFERHSSNPLGTPFYSEDTPQMLAEYFAESFGIACTPEKVECPTCQGVGSSYEDHVGNCPDCWTPENVESPK